MSFNIPQWQVGFEREKKEFFNWTRFQFYPPPLSLAAAPAPFVAVQFNNSTIQHAAIY